MDETFDRARHRLDVLAAPKGVEQLDQEERVSRGALGELVHLRGHQRRVVGRRMDQLDRLCRAERLELQTDERIPLVGCHVALPAGAAREDHEPGARPERRL